MDILSTLSEYKMANGRHIMIGEGSHRNLERNMSFVNTSRLIVTPIKQLSITGDFHTNLIRTVIIGVQII